MHLLHARVGLGKSLESSVALQRPPPQAQKGLGTLLLGAVPCGAFMFSRPEWRAFVPELMAGSFASTDPDVLLWIWPYIVNLCHVDDAPTLSTVPVLVLGGEVDAAAWTSPLCGTCRHGLPRVLGEERLQQRLLSESRELGCAAGSVWKFQGGSQEVGLDKSLERRCPELAVSNAV